MPPQAAPGLLRIPGSDRVTATCPLVRNEWLFIAWLAASAVALGLGWAAFAGTVAFGVAQVGLSLLPYLGSRLNLLIALTGFGAVFLTRFGLQRFRPQSAGEPVS